MENEECKIIEDPNLKMYRVGECRYCHNMVTVEGDENMTREEVDQLATSKCDCAGARLATKQQNRLDAAKYYVRNRLQGNESQIDLMVSAIDAVFIGSVDTVTIKIEKHTYRIALDGDGMIIIKITFRDTGTEEF